MMCRGAHQNNGVRAMHITSTLYGLYLLFVVSNVTANPATLEDTFKEYVYRWCGVH